MNEINFYGFSKSIIFFDPISIYLCRVHEIVVV